MDSSGSGQGPVALSCKHDNYPSRSKNANHFVASRDLQYENFTPWTRQEALEDVF